MPFGVYLGLTVSTLKQIQKDQLTTDRCRMEMLLTWGKEQTPTWLKVIQALVKIRMFHLAVKIASKYGKFLQSARDTYAIYLQHFCTVCEISIYVAADILLSEYACISTKYEYIILATLDPSFPHLHAGVTVTKSLYNEMKVAVPEDKVSWYNLTCTVLNRHQINCLCLLTDNDCMDMLIVGKMCVQLYTAAVYCLYIAEVR